MAGTSAKEIKSRIRSMGSTKQITKAMELVASSKLRRAQDRLQSARPYFETLQEATTQLLAAGGERTSAYLQGRPGGRFCSVIIAGDRGLAGGYNHNVLKTAQEMLEGKDCLIVPVGKKATDFFAGQRVPLLTDDYAQAEALSAQDCFCLADTLCKGFLAGDFTALNVVYTRFVSALSQRPEVLPLLPLVPGQRKPGHQVLYEPEAQQTIAAVVPQYLGGILYGALCESQTAEQAARRTTMDAAARNADEMIGKLRLEFNRARQAAITQEITEIIAGAKRS